MKYKATINSRPRNVQRGGKSVWLFSAVVDGRIVDVKLDPDGTTEPIIPGFGQSAAITGQFVQDVLVASDVQKG